MQRRVQLEVICKHDHSKHAINNAVAFLAAREDVDLTEFDSKALPYSVPSAHFIRNLFGKRFKIIWGLSMTTLPRFIEVKVGYLYVYKSDLYILLKILHTT